MKLLHTLFLLLIAANCVSQDLRLSWKDVDLKGYVKEIKYEFFYIESEKAEKYESKGFSVIQFNTEGYVTSVKTWEGDKVFYDVKYSHDKKGRPIHGINSAKDRYFYDYKELFISYNDQANTILFSGLKNASDTVALYLKEFDELNRLVKLTALGFDGAEDLIQLMKYDKMGRILSKTVYEGKEMLNQHIYEYLGRLKVRTAIIDKNGESLSKEISEKNIQGDVVKQYAEDKDEKSAELWEYEYDQKGNWIIKKSTLGGEFKDLTKRQITYY